jgi:single-strand DNA-binding protein
MNETTITITGNLTDNPELRFTPTGTAVTRFRIASTPRYQDQAGQWKDGDTLFLTCTAWRQLAENVAESLEKGARVIVTGRLAQRSYDTEDGKRTVYEVQADDAGASLRTASAKVTKTTRTRADGTGGEPAAADGYCGEPPF